MNDKAELARAKAYAADRVKSLDTQISEIDERRPELVAARNEYARIAGIESDKPALSITAKAVAK
jgi:hypothetical protein